MKFTKHLRYSNRNRCGSERSERLLSAKFSVSRNDDHLGESKHRALHRRGSLANYNGQNKARDER